MCGNNENLKVCLEIDENIPIEPVFFLTYYLAKAEILIWKSENIGLIYLCPKIFLTDIQNNPVLSKSHQELLINFLPYCPNVILQSYTPDTDLTKYKFCLFNLFDQIERYTENQLLDYSYKDYLQSPLQPLMNNLESSSYETFENDKTKYECYYAALISAFTDFKKSNKKKLKILLVGPGRGPLIKVAFKASYQMNLEISMVAVEKNKNAMITLLNLQNSVPFKEKLQIFESDIRNFECSEKFDIILSELLGSFGDNELSPECLDAAEKFLAENGIFIPCKYTSYLQPITSEKLWLEAKNQSNLSVNGFEIPYVVNIFSAFFISPSQPVFTFQHPKSPISETSNSRYQKCEFINKTPLNLYVNGFAGYFEALLYDKILLSILPETHTKDLHSWFPIYFPIEKPLLVEPQNVIKIDIWRDTNEKSVWYEWLISIKTKKSIMQTTNIHNVKGKSYSIGLY